MLETMTIKEINLVCVLVGRLHTLACNRDIRLPTILFVAFQIPTGRGLDMDNAVLSDINIAKNGYTILLWYTDYIYRRYSVIQELPKDDSEWQLRGVYAEG